MADNKGHGLVQRRIEAIVSRLDSSVETETVLKSTEMGVMLNLGSSYYS